MTLINKFDAQSIETISRIIGSIMTGSTITKMLEQLNIEDNSNQSTKWRRLDFVMRETQTTYDCGNKVLEIIKYVFHPTSSWFSDNNGSADNNDIPAVPQPPPAPEVPSPEA